MEAVSYQKRLDDMSNVSTSRTQKRGYCYFTPDNHVVPFEKRQRSIQWEARNGTMSRLFPSSAQPIVRNLDEQFRGNSLGIFSPRPQFSPQAHPLPTGPLLKDVITGPVSRNEVGNPKRANRKSLLVRRDSGPLSLTLSRDEQDNSNALGMHHNEEDSEKEAMRRELKEHREFSRAAMEALERAHAKELKDTVELEIYKERIRVLNDAKISQGFQNASGLTEGSSFFPPYDSWAGTKSSFPGDLVVTVGSMSGSGSPSDEENASRGEGTIREKRQDPEWKELWNKVQETSRIEKAVSLEKEIEYTQSRLLALQLERPSKFKAEKKPEDKTLVDAFTPLSAEAEEAVDEALESGERHENLVTHEKSNIDVTRGIMQCLLPGVWLNDEVINVYMELLKEREMREPDRFLKCHFFNTFFYNKLFKDKRSYDYKAIRRWTTQKKLGYSLSDCDKILVPIHQDIHWCLAVINIRDKRLEYLDSLKGRDHSVLDVLARYISDEAKDKDGKVLDISTWDQDFPKNIPEQLNGCDCGMFMVKYADFHSRGAPLQFSQDNMEYFRRKMVWEILDLHAT